MASSISHNSTYSYRTGAVCAPAMWDIQRRGCSASLTEVVRSRLPMAAKRCGAKVSMRPAGSRLSVQKRAIEPSPSSTHTEQSNMAALTLSALAGSLVQGCLLEFSSSISWIGFQFPIHFVTDSIEICESLGLIFFSNYLVSCFNFRSQI
jgi:hypothetical protein